MRLGSPTANGSCDQNELNSGISILPLIPFESAFSGASMHAIFTMLTVVVELLCRERESFASSSPSAIMMPPSPESTSRIRTRHQKPSPRPTFLMSPTYCCMLPLPISYFIEAVNAPGGRLYRRVLIPDLAETGSSMNPISLRVDSYDPSPRRIDHLYARSVLKVEPMIPHERQSSSPEMPRSRGGVERRHPVPGAMAGNQ